MDSVGAYLKSVREEQNLSLEQVAEMTMLKERILQDMENDQFDALGGVGYARAMVCTYCKALGVDQAEALRLLNLKSNFTPRRVIAESDTQTKPVILPSSIFSIILLVIVVIVMGVIVWNLHSQGKLSSPIQKSVKPKVESTQEQPEPEPLDLSQEEHSELVVQSDFNSKALHDSTDYVNDYMFKGQKNPLNVKVN
jgi:cytoskeletal protein RodZ